MRVVRVRTLHGWLLLAREVEQGAGTEAGLARALAHVGEHAAREIGHQVVATHQVRSGLGPHRCRRLALFVGVAVVLVFVANAQLVQLGLVRLGQLDVDPVLDGLQVGVGRETPARTPAIRHPHHQLRRPLRAYVLRLGESSCFVCVVSCRVCRVCATRQDGPWCGEYKHEREKEKIKYDSRNLDDLVMKMMDKHSGLPLRKKKMGLLKLTTILYFTGTDLIDWLLKRYFSTHDIPHNIPGTTFHALV